MDRAGAKPIKGVPVPVQVHVHVTVINTILNALYLSAMQ